MRTVSNPLLPLLRSKTQAELLALLYLRPDQEFTLTEVAREIGASVKSVHQEANRLVACGYISDAKRGNLRLVRAILDTPVAGPLTALLAVTFGPIPILRDLLADVEGMSEALIYGSWAARYHGHEGPYPGDIDVMIVGTIDADTVYQLEEQAEKLVGAPVSIHIVTGREWEHPSLDNGFLQTVQKSPVVPISQSPSMRL